MGEPPTSINFTYRALQNDENKLLIEEKMIGLDGINSTVQNFLMEKQKFFDNYVYQQLSIEELLKMKQSIEDVLNAKLKRGN